MGTMMHLITEVRKEGKWHIVPMNPESLCECNYNTFAVLAGVRDSFGIQVFKSKGLPSDMSSKKFGFKSFFPQAIKRYENDTEQRIKINNPDSSVSYLSMWTQETEVEITVDEYNAFKQHNPDPSIFYDLCYSNNGKEHKYTIKNASVIGGKLVDVPYKDLYGSFWEFYKTHYEEYWNEDKQDCGEWEIDFDSCYDGSYLSLRELLNGDYTLYDSTSYKMDKEFYDKFVAEGGILPDCFTVRESSTGDSIIEVVREAMSPTVTISWKQVQEKIDELPIHKGIKELAEIAKQYSVSEDDIRIVFAFS